MLIRGVKGGAHRADVHHVILGNRALERNMGRAADDDVGRIVSEQGENLVVGQVVTDLAGAVGRGAVHHQDFATVDQRDTLLLRQTAKALRH